MDMNTPNYALVAECVNGVALAPGVRAGNLVESMAVGQRGVHLLVEAVEFRRLLHVALGVPAVFRRRQAALLAELPVEVGQVVEAGLEAGRRRG